MKNWILPVTVLLTIGLNSTYVQRVKDQLGKPTNIQIYLTAKETADRLTRIDYAVLKDFRQPVETQTSVFVDFKDLGRL